MIQQLVLGNEQRISGSNPICVKDNYDCIYITGKAKEYLIENTAYMQPVIGHRTLNNLPYGRWKMADGITKKIVIDGVKLHLKSVVKNFTIGEYGRKDVPIVECVNGGSLDAVETAYERIMIYNAVEDFYSNGLITTPRYEVQSENTLFTFDEYQMNVIDTYRKKNVDLSDMSVHYSPVALSWMGEWLSKGFNPNAIYRELVAKEVLDWLAAALLWGCNILDINSVQSSADKIHKLICNKFCSMYNSSTNDENYYSITKKIFRENIAKSMMDVRLMSDASKQKYIWLVSPYETSSDIDNGIYYKLCFEENLNG